MVALLGVLGVSNCSRLLEVPLEFRFCKRARLGFSVFSRLRLFATLAFFFGFLLLLEFPAPLFESVLIFTHLIAALMKVIVCR